MAKVIASDLYMEKFWMEKFTQNQAVDYECAKEVITDMMALCTLRINETDKKDLVRLNELRAYRSKLARERALLCVNDDDQIFRIRNEYGVIVRTWRAEQNLIGV